MAKRLLTISFIIVMTMVAPVCALGVTYTGYAGIEQIDESISITIRQQTAIISGAEGKRLEVVSLTGRPMLSIKIESSVQTVELNIPKGCYILKVGNVVRKVTIK